MVSLMTRPVINERVFDHENMIKLLIESHEINRVLMDRLYLRISNIEAKLGIAVDEYGKHKV